MIDIQILNLKVNWILFKINFKSPDLNTGLAFYKLEKIEYLYYMIK